MKTRPCGRRVVP